MRIKQVEIMLDRTISPKSHFLVRLDGVSFHTFLKGVQKPFDPRITDAMVKTTADLLTQFNATLGYTCSDEISLIFPAIDQESRKKKNGKEINTVHQYNGRVQKLCSVTAGYASARFNHHLQNPKNQWEREIVDKMTNSVAYFDGRVCSFDSPVDMADCIFWRSNFDCFRNAISQISVFHLKHKGVQGKNVIQLLEALRLQNIDVLNGTESRFLFGTWVKRRLLLVEKLNPVSKQMVQIYRSKVCCGSFNWAEWTTEERTEFTINRLWLEKDDSTNHPPIDIHCSEMLMEN
jgi:tRNA(His) guanylyltransferase